MWAAARLAIARMSVRERFGIAPLETFIALPQSFCDGAGHRFAGGLGDRLCETVGFRVLDVEAHGVSTYPVPIFYLSIIADLPTHRKGRTTSIRGVKKIVSSLFVRYNGSMCNR